MGSLSSLDSIFEVQHSALDADVQTTLLPGSSMSLQIRDDVLAPRVAKAVAYPRTDSGANAYDPGALWLSACTLASGEGNRSAAGRRSAREAQIA